MSQKPSIPKGTRDFSPQEMARRNYIFDTIKSVFCLYGFLPIETPAMENLSTLLGKYGDEGDKLLFRILNSGDFLAGVDSGAIGAKDSQRAAAMISEKGLRYDLTVPFARYVVQHRNDITFPFKRYQIQSVWRADRPQKGRYREFFQCDADIVGSESLLNEYEFVRIIDEVFKRLGIKTVVKINNRKILAGVAGVIGEAARITDITVAIDKLDKIGEDNVIAELLAKGITQEAAARLRPIMKLSGTSMEKLNALELIIGGNDEGRRGIEEVRTLFDYLAVVNLETEVELDLTLARGLNYYTGAIFEVKAKEVEIGSISGGGRYDDLTGVFGMPGVSGVGISFGADRIYDVMLQLELFPVDTVASTKVMFVNFGRQEEAWCLPVIDRLREAGVPAEIFPEAAKMPKQMKWADNKNIPFVVMAGADEISAGAMTLKNMRTGDQRPVSVEELLSALSAYTF